MIVKCDISVTCPSNIFSSIAGPNRYTVDPMMGVTVRSGKPTCPKYSMCFRHMHGSYLHDLSKVRSSIDSGLSWSNRKSYTGFRMVWYFMTFGEGQIKA